MDKKIGLLLIVVILSNIIYGYFINSDNESERISLNESEIILDDEYEVISSFYMLQGSVQSAKLVIEQLTANDRVDDSSFNRFENYTKIKLDASLINDFKKKNANTYKLENKISIPKNFVVLISEKKGKDIFRDDVGWLRFYMKYPDSYSGINTISRVGFNDNRTQALFYHGFALDWYSAEGNLILLTKENGKWMIKAKYRLWRA